jgi:putative restriction endonuclease
MILTVKAYVGVTDEAWYRDLAARRLDEVNFWRPAGGRVFRALTPGEPFFFKTHFPHNQVVGGGFFSGFAALRVSEAWEFFGEANGAATIEVMRTRVARYRRRALSDVDDPVIGCVFVRDVRFLPDDRHVAAPPQWHANLVQGRSYDLAADAAYQSYFDPLLTQLFGISIEVDDAAWHRSGPVYGEPRLTQQRLGQRSFQAVVLDAYHHRCAVTGDKIRPVLQAAHIRPVSNGGEHRLDNGLLLRSDVHTLFDRGYLGVDPTYRLQVSPRLRHEFGNGEEFYRRAESKDPIILPDRRSDRPYREFLEWHLDEVFLAS